LQLVGQASDIEARLHRGDEVVLSIGFTSSAPLINAVSNALFTFRPRYPAVHVEMQEINTRQQLAPLSDGLLDLGVMRYCVLPETFHHQVLIHDGMFALVLRAVRLSNRLQFALFE
ncbi:LysR substrate-binding domain-containing protein, partial [Erwinia amylovora]|uniref:LysR substrate-binding domain-containing protein n=1 Tax=Erwinia amylovora TaxID=552 RepID=UPI0020BED773